jgi:hypothetical protein
MGQAIEAADHLGAGTQPQHAIDRGDFLSTSCACLSSRRSTSRLTVTEHQETLALASTLISADA